MLLTTLTALALAAAPARPVVLAPAEAESIATAIAKDREDTRAWLKGAPTSYLATVRRVDFLARTSLSVGRAADNDVRLDDPSLAAHHLRVTVAGDSFRVAALDDTAHFVAGKAVQRAATVSPSSIQAGRFALRLSHQRFPAIIVFDPRSPRFADYKGIDYFPIDLRLRYVLPLIPNPHPDTTVILSTRGNQRRAVRVGWFDFMMAGTRCRLEAERLLEPCVGEHDVAVFFRDATTGKESYGVGRYLDPQALADGRYVLDFNLAYNPACAYSEHYNCPIPPRANHLTVAVRAGEKDSHYQH
ncbi:MAG: DUF1684 domain-containing protein [Candidatus Eisenbacteria bacterium]|nr:DUF1684 domain-containing protein [Candidatus Eisenbacteria bacterium]